MKDAPPSLSRDVVLIGGGHTHALVLREWGMNPVKGARLTLINPAPSAPYTGMLPGFVAGHYSRDALEIDLVRLARFAGARMIFGYASAIDRTAKRIRVDGRPDVAYDFASIDIGITSDIPALPGFVEHGIAAKPLGPFASAWDAFAETKTGKDVAVIGGGIGGVELAMAMNHRLSGTAKITIIDRGEALSGVRPQTRAALLSELTSSGIELSENSRPIQVTDRAVILEDGREVKSTFTVSAAGARPFEWLSETGLNLTDGFIDVDATLRSTEDRSIYATGDCAHLTHAPRPKAGVFAVRAAPVLAANLRADLAGRPRKRFQPQAKYLKLISLGRKAAIADKYTVAPQGAWVWKWKDRIDQAFMSRLSEWPRAKNRLSAPLVAKTSLQSGDLCGGCGAKVAGSVLDKNLAALDKVDRPDVLTGPGDDAAILRASEHNQVITTDHLRAFWNDPYVMTKIATVHALNDVLAMGATPQAFLPHLTLPRMSEEIQDRTLEECFQAYGEIAKDVGASIVGGHTSMGAEMTVGLTVTGLLEGPVRALAGAKPGDVLVLSKPIGSGTILAAEMQGKARGDDVRDCLNTMVRLDLAVAKELALQCSAMTDVTGFGLAGHATRMADKSEVTFEIELAAVPFYAGAESLAEAGVRSTIYDANRRTSPVKTTETARSALLFDPQTSGGFLAAVPAERVSNISEVTVIGQCLPRGASALVIA